MAALLSVAPGAQAQTAPTNAQLLDQLIAQAKPGATTVMQGDMVLSVAELRTLRGKTGTGKQAASAFYRTNLWVDGNVPYVIDQTLLPAQRPLFTQAIRALETFAHLKFTPRTNEADYIRVFTDPTAIGFSYSRIGRIGGQQDLSLGDGGNVYTAIHEIMHALGVMHEQSRNDRDNFVTIDFTNIAANQAFNYAKVDDSNNRGPYDFDSVMHYGQYDFAIDPSKPTMIVKAPNQRFQNLIGLQDNVSTLDKDGLVSIYGPPGEIVRPVNDLFSKGQVLQGPAGSITGSNVYATTESGEPVARNTSGNTIWYRWRPANNGTVIFNTLGSPTDTVLSVYVGPTLRTLTNVTSNDDTPLTTTTSEAALTSSVTFPAQANATYYISVDSSADPLSFSKTGITGAITLNWNQNVEASRSKLSGSVKTSAGQGVAGVVISLSGADANNKATVGTATTNSAGEYSISGLLAGTYNLRPVKTAFTFSPNPLRVKVSGASVGNNFVATATPESLLPEMFVSDVSVREGRESDSIVTFNVSLSAPSKDTITVNYSTLNGTALAGGDYNTAKGTLTFAPGVMTLTVTVRVRPDSVVEDDETFGLKISGAIGAKIVDEMGIATLVNDDSATASGTP